MNYSALTARLKPRPFKTKSPLQNKIKPALMRFKRASGFADNDKESIGAVDFSVQSEASRCRNRFTLPSARHCLSFLRHRPDQMEVSRLVR
jgi:hypothetical protein